MKVKHSKKGEMLIESVIAMAVAAMILCCLFATLKSFFSISKKEKEFVKAESICLDIDKFYDTYGGEVTWARYYFDEEPAIEDGKYRVFYNSSFEVAKEADKQVYELAYFYDVDGLHVDFKNIISDKMIIQNLIYGTNDVSNVDASYLNSLEEYIVEVRKGDEIPEEEKEEEPTDPEEGEGGEEEPAEPEEPSEEETPVEPSEEDGGNEDEE